MSLQMLTLVHQNISDGTKQELDKRLATPTISLAVHVVRQKMFSGRGISGILHNTTSWGMTPHETA